MHPSRVLARPMLASVFVASGVDVLRNPGPRVAKAQDVAPQLAEKLGLPKDTELLVKVNAATHVLAGSMLAIGKFRRLSSLALLASMVPTTYAGHRFWEMDDPQERAQNQVHFLKNLAVMGGLLLEVVDTEGRPSVGWLSKRAARSAAAATAASAPVVKGAAAMKAVGAASDAATSRMGKKALHATGTAKGASELSGRAAKMAKKAAKTDLVATGTARARDLAQKAAKADLVIGAAGKGKDLAQKAAKADAVVAGTAKAKDLAHKAAKADLVATGTSKARELAGAAAKAQVSKNLASKAIDIGRSADLQARTAAATAAVERLAS